MTHFVYLALAGENRIAIYTMDPDSGRLRFNRNVPLGGAVGPLTADPGRQYLYAGIRSTCEMASLRIAPDTGNLTLIGRVPLEADPCFLATDRRGRFLLSAYYGAGAVAVHRISPDGTLDDIPVQWLATAPNAHAIQTDPSNRFALVPHIAGPNVILQFEFDEQNGTLTPNRTPSVSPEERVGPRHFVFHPRLPVVYFVNEQGSSVTAYQFDRSAGTLRAFQTISTLPAGFSVQNTCAQIHIAPSGAFLYASNRGHDSIACFAVDAATGGLNTIGQQSTEEMPRAFNLDPEGRFLYAAGLVSGRLASYRIDGQTGTLQPMQTYLVGERPMWVLVLRLGND